jgi:hypothetical protein
MKFISGLNIRRLMRVHHLTIRMLATRMNITMKRVRAVRQDGITGECMCLDWYEAITGKGIFAPKVSLPDGYNGATMVFFAAPVETHGDLVKLHCAEPGRDFLMAWTLSTDVATAVSNQVHS